MALHRSWLFVPGDRPDFFAKAFERGTDVVVVDLEDGVAPGAKEEARELVFGLIRRSSAWVRVNRPGSEECARDLAALAPHVAGIRVPKVESAADAAWIVERAEGKPVSCTIETARGLVECEAIAGTAGVAGLVFGAEDYRRDLRCSGDADVLRYARSRVVAAARAAGLDPPLDGAYTGLGDLNGLAAACVEARRLGFGGKSAVHPEQVATINRVFAPDDDERRAAGEVVAAFNASRGRPTRTTGGDLVDLPVAARAQALLEEHDADA